MSTVATMQTGDVFIIRGSRYTCTRTPEFTPDWSVLRFFGVDKKGAHWVFHSPASVERIIAKADVKTRKKSVYPFRYTQTMFNDSVIAQTEKNDCTVRSLAIAADIDYYTAYFICADKGRKPKKGFPFRSCNNMVVGNYKMVFNRVAIDYSGPRRKGKTLRQLIKSGELPKRAIVFMAGHVAAVVDGILYDTFKPGARTVIEGYYALESVWKTGVDALK